jgi:hypothetical protein
LHTHLKVVHFVTNGLDIIPHACISKRNVKET